MNEIFRALSEKERKHLRLLWLILGVFLVFLLLVSFRERRSFRRLDSTLASRTAELAKVEKLRSEAAAERAKWEQAEKDLGDLKAKRFYQDKDGANVLRLDLQQLFARAGISAQTLKFDYADLEKLKARKVSVAFNFTGSYAVLKRFLETIEEFPKFLCLERLDFVRIMGGGSTLELRAILAGYYANF